MNDLERLLSQPMAEVADDGFSLQLLRRIRRYQLLKSLLIATLLLGLVALFFLLFPLADFIATIGRLAADATSVSDNASGLLSRQPPGFVTHIVQQLVQQPMAIIALAASLITLIAWQHN